MDAQHEWGNDLSLNPSGDLALAAAPALTQQRVLRRLLTDQGDYIWQTSYGAGLAQFVGTPANPLQIRSVIRSQIFAESAVAATPEPSVAVTVNQGGSVFVQLTYTDVPTASPQVLSFSVG